MASSTVVACCR